jgi:uncharacterized protein YkwD
MTSRRRLGRPASLLVALLLVATLLPASAASASTSTVDLERDFHALVNVERAKAGLHSLDVKSDIVKVARGHSAKMASEWRLYHNPTYTTQITGWQRISENVGYGPSVRSIHRALMESEGHRRNIMDDRVTQVGIGVTVKDGRVWVTQNFRRPRTDVTFSTASTIDFGDVTRGSTHADSIVKVARAGIMDPCGVARFCPLTDVTRGEFASHLVRALDLPRPNTTTSRFSDVPSSQAADVEALASAGLTTGCSAGKFCPDVRLTREQLSTFFARALQLEPVPTTFSDVGTTHGGNVGALQKAGIVNGCGATTFCPSQRITRQQTASMIARNFA